MDYDLADGKVDRIVCGPEAEQFMVSGMPAYDVSHIDPSLKGYYGVHIGSWEPWLPILIRDGYCDTGDIYIFQIDIDAADDDNVDFFEMQDPHVIDPDAPASKLIFSQLRVISPRYLKLERRMTQEEARALYEDDAQYDEDSGEWIHPFDI